jgi:hypothetical protein
MQKSAKHFRKNPEVISRIREFYADLKTVEKVVEES